MIILEVAAPFYLDWMFWSVIVASIAIVLSQLPPLHVMLRRAKLEVELYSRMLITHKIGNPNGALHIIINNVGGREIRIKEMALRVHPGTKDEFVLTGNSYFRSPEDKAGLLLTPFRLKPGEQWAYTVNFFTVFSRQEEKAFREIQSNLRNDINGKLKINRNELAVAEEQNVRPIMDFFKNKFRWQPGEYKFRLEIETEPKQARFTKEFRLTLFESDSKELESYCNEYKSGFCVYIDSSTNLGLWLRLTEG
ncbi:MAG: hypothetical protein WA738_14850 [Candidatus Angelobacter sp.]